MTHIRRPLAALLALFTGAIVIDRLGLTGSGDTMSSWVYVLALSFALLPLALPGLRRSRPIAPLVGATAVYLVASFTFRGRPNLIGDDMFIAVVELAFLALASLLGHRVGVAIQDIDDTLGVVAFGESPAIDLESQLATNEILAEMARSRRHDRPLSVTVVQPDHDSVRVAVDRAGEEVQRAIRTQYVRAKLARALADELRRTDLLFEHPGTGNFVVLSPETESEGAELVAVRAREASRRIGISIESGSASFPDHAFTFEQLVAEAERRVAEVDIPKPRIAEVRDMRAGQ
ncbi:hypothetical protein HQ535_03120 [bacterium]|nr:hypothetical protein [bacterium]